MDREGSIELIDAAVIVRGADGKVRFEETADPSGKKGPSAVRSRAASSA
jgi:hypothetical protein